MPPIPHSPGPDDTAPLDTDAAGAVTLLGSLRAVRRFAAQPVPEEALRDILDVARWTGSGKNRQPWELVVVRDPQTLRELAMLGEYAGHLAGAQAGIVLVMDPGAEFDAGRLAQNIMLTAWAHGIGSCVASLYPDDNERRAKAILGVPVGRSARTAISLGYPADGDARRVRSAPDNVRAAVTPGRKSLAELVSWERYGRRAS